MSFTPEQETLFSSVDKFRFDVAHAKKRYWVAKGADAKDERYGKFQQAKKAYYSAVSALTPEEIRAYGDWVKAQSLLLAL